MAAYTGYGGQVKVDTAGGAPGVLLGVRSWEVEDKADFEDTTQMAAAASGRRAKTITLTDWSITIEGFIDSAETNWKGAPPVIKAGASLDVELYLDGSSATLLYSGQAIVVSCTPRLAVDGVLTFTIQAEGTGSLDYPTDPA